MAEPMEGIMPEELIQQRLRCSVCQDIFKTPLVLPCTHSFCQECLQGTTKFSGNRCPLCRQDFAEGQAILNRALSDICQTYARYPPSGSQKPDSVAGCKMHMKPLVLYCEKDEQPVCVDCVTLHSNHTLWPLTEAVPSCKVNMPEKKDGLGYKALYSKTIFIIHAVRRLSWSLCSKGMSQYIAN